ncbi:MAG: N-acetylmuramic acid 6-phosphate etherase [Kosmotogaceae bacterium]
MREELKRLITEKSNEKTKNIDRVPVREKLRMINDEDKTVPYAVEKALPEIEKVIGLTVKSLKRSGKVIYIGAGTSGRMGVVDASEIFPTFGEANAFEGIIAGGFEALVTPIENAEDLENNGREDIDNIGVTEKDTIIGITASGRTPYVIAALRRAKEIGAHTAAISNISKPLVRKVVDISIEVVTGPEVITGSTRMKAGTSQKMILNMISTVTMIEMGKVYQNLMVDLVVTNKKLEQRAIKTIELATDLEYDIARDYYEKSGKLPRAAIYMALTGSSREEALTKLKNAEGHLYRALEEN